MQLKMTDKTLRVALLAKKKCYFYQRLSFYFWYGTNGCCHLIHVVSHLLFKYQLENYMLDDRQTDIRTNYVRQTDNPLFNNTLDIFHVC